MPHAPGPWAFTVGDAERRASSAVYKADDKEFRIAEVVCEWQNRQQRAEDIANAALIAAAPDLLAALKAIMSNQLTGNVDLDAERFVVARAAIAKAEATS